MKARTRERRQSSDRVYNSLEAHLNPVQMVALHQIENFGWSLKYVRKPLFMDPVPIVFHTSMKSYAVLEFDGTLNQGAAVALRNLP